MGELLRLTLNKLQEPKEERILTTNN